MNREKVNKGLFMCIALILMLVILYSGLRVLESTIFYTQQDEGEVESRWIVRDGVEYYPRQDIVVVMFLGIDRQGKLEENESNSGFAADMVMLMIFDEKNEECSVLCLNRDSMVMMPGLNEHGSMEGTYYAQLALSHTFGSGMEDSCENTRKTVSDLLYGINIDYYLSMNMDAVALVNDAVGGVTVNVVDDFSDVDPSIGMGEITLHGQQAFHYVHTRKGLGDQLNLSRMERHKEYMEGFLVALRNTLDTSSTFGLEVYEELAPYLVTDISSTVFNSMLQRYSDYDLVQIVTTEGENVLGERHYEFYLDEDKLDELILKLFYAPR